MSESDLFRRMQARVRARSYALNRQTLISILPLRQSPPCEPLPWEPDRIELKPDERQLLACLCEELNHELSGEELISEADVLNFALHELQLKLTSGNRQDMVLRLGFHLLNLRR